MLQLRELCKSKRVGYKIFSFVNNAIIFEIMTAITRVMLAHVQLTTSELTNYLHTDLGNYPIE